MTVRSALPLATRSNLFACQSKKSAYKASAMRQGATLSTQLYSELTGEDGATESGDNGNTENGGGSSSSGSNEGPVNP